MKRQDREFEVGDLVLLKVSPMKGVLHFGKKGKLAPRFIGPFPIIERIGKVAYRLALPERFFGVHNVFHVSMLRKNVCDADQHPLIDYHDLELQKDASYEEKPYKIVDRREHVLRRKTIPMVKVQWHHHNDKEVTWEREDDMLKRYPDLFEDTESTT
ncbi:uncharacterized protein LOC113296323 [Papaver somniferum]|uniref:uncharacterized protein LOC113296323 n=1 Tax=Papaver somniferum TaxID=3469 RepID=UPI000E6F610A|nr:uncharacterized protein LOC113296323 [Papaver somniferum]